MQSQNQNGASDAYTYDVDNRLATVTDSSGQTTYAYDNVGNLQSFAYPNGVTTAYTYDTLNRLKQMGAGKNGTLQANYVYTLGAVGNRLTVAELIGRTVNYGYDSLYRLTSEQVIADPSNHNGTTQYQYDNVGNRQQLIVNGTTANVYSYDADDRLGSDQYDPNGNTTVSGGTTSTYDFENHLISKGGVTIVYDGDGNRVSETVAGVTTQYLVDTQNPTGYAQVVDEIQNGAVTKTYSYGLERISQRPTTNGQGPSFYGYDGHGSVRFLTDASGNVTDTYDYDAFGNLINSTGSTPNNYLFAGEQYDPALSLYYNRARYMNTATGRFWSMDDYSGDPSSPISLHKYLYASGNPANRIDPTGNEDLAELAEVGAVQSVLQSMATMSLKGALLGGLFGAVDAALQNKPGKEILLAAAKGGLIGAVLGPLTKIKFVAPVLVALGTTSGVASTVDAIEQKNFGLAAFRAAATFVGFRTFVEEPIQGGGRLGTADTRYQLSQYAKFLESRGWTITGGGGVAPEEYLPGSGPGTQGANYLDLTAQRNGTTLRINTVTTLSDGITPTTEEAAAAALIRSKIDPNDPFILIPKWSLPDWYQPTK